MTAKHEPTDEQRRQVESMSGFGLKHEQMAAVLQIDAKTLRKHYRTELDVGMAKAHAKVGESLYKMALDGNVTAAIWFTKAQMGWAETVKHTGDEEHPVIHEVRWVVVGAED